MTITFVNTLLPSASGCLAYIATSKLAARCLPAVITRHPVILRIIALTTAVFVALLTLKLVNEYLSTTSGHPNPVRTQPAPTPQDRPASPPPPPAAPAQPLRVPASQTDLAFIDSQVSNVMDELTRAIADTQDREAQDRLGAFHETFRANPKPFLDVLKQPSYLQTLYARERHPTRENALGNIPLILATAISENTLPIAEIVPGVYIGSEFAAATLGLPKEQRVPNPTHPLFDHRNYQHLFIINMAGDFQARRARGLPLEEASCNFFPETFLYADCIGTTDDSQGDIDLNAFADMIQEALLQGRPVFIHCKQGKSRSGVVVMGWLMKYGRGRDANGQRITATYDQTIQYFKQQRFGREDVPMQVLPNATFLAKLGAFEGQLRGVVAPAAAAAAYPPGTRVFLNNDLWEKARINRNGEFFIILTTGGVINLGRPLGDTHAQCSGKDAIAGIHISAEQWRKLLTGLEANGISQAQADAAVSVL